jgi:hypothetical protein
MLTRLGGRLVTSPLAFLVAGAIDVSWILLVYARWRLGRWRSGRAQAGGGPAVNPPS